MASNWHLRNRRNIIRKHGLLAGQFRHTRYGDPPHFSEKDKENWLVASQRTKRYGSFYQDIAMLISQA